MNFLKKILILVEVIAKGFNLSHVKKILTGSFIISFFLLLNINEGKAQGASGMPFSFSVTPTVAASPIWTNMPVPGAFVDEWDTLLVPAGWSFVFAGVAYNKVVISSNGWVALIPTASAAVNPLPYPANSLPNNLLSNNTTGFPIIAPLWDDLSTSLVRFNLTGNTLSINWFVKWQKANATANTSLIWIDLNGTPGVNTVGFHYINNAAYPPLTPSASIGIAGPCTGDFYSVSCQTALTATTDSSVENINIGPGTPNNFRPNNVNFLFTPYHPYDNCTASYPARNLGTINSTCTNFISSTYNATVSGAGNCSTTDDNDVWFSFIKPIGSSSLTVTTSPSSCQSVTGTSVEVYSSCGGALLGCSATGPTFANYGEVTLIRPTCSIETLLVRVTADGDIEGKFNICVKSNTPTVGPLCSTAAPICAPLPFNSLGNTTAGSLNNYFPSAVPGYPGIICQSNFMKGQDYVYAYTPSITQCVTISIDGTGANSYPGLFLLDGCPDDTVNSHCVASATNTSNGDTISNLTLSAGQTYYIIVDNDSSLAGFGTIPFNLHLSTSAAAAPPNDACGAAASLGIIPATVTCVWSASYTTQCANPSPVAGYPSPGCGDFIPASTNDVWFTFTPSFSGVLLINTQGSGTNPVIHGGIAVYTGTCGSLNLVSCSGDSVAVPFMPSISVGVTNSTVYYIRFWSSPGYDPGTFQLCFNGNCAPPNDFPVNAITLPLATPTIGDNTCSTGLQEMPNPLSCTTPPVNTVWYKIVIPATGSYAVRISQISMQDAAVGAFLFPGGPALAATSFTSLACNDDIIFAPPCPICGMTGDNDAAIQFTATAGQTVYIAVDGEGSSTGTFYITIIQGTLSSNFPPVYRKDCSDPEFICANNNYYLPNGGVGSDGNICDFQNLTCSGGATVSEVGSAWLSFTVAAGSSLGFTVTPNDSAAPVANYNFFLWDITGVSNFCSNIGTSTPLRCNTTAGTGKTGCRNPITTVFSNTVPAQGTNRTYMLYVQNLTSANDDEGSPGTNIGFLMDWGIYTGGVLSGYTSLVGTSASCYWKSPAPVVDNNYQNLANWKGIGTCPAILPTCTTDVYVSAANFDCTVSGVSYARNITINAGGVLRLLPGSVYHVCGDFTNNGSLFASAGSTVIFEGNVNQNIIGAFTGANSYANVIINKLNSTQVILNNNVDITQNFTTANATSWFNINGKYMKVGGDFTNASGTTTFLGYGNSTVEFNGLLNQFFTNYLLPIYLNRVVMNKPLAKLYLNGAFSTMNIDTALTLTKGIIVTRQLPTLEVNMKYYLPTSITGHNVLSYVDGQLRRKISNPIGPASPLIPASYDFPVGDSLAIGGYELANVTFTSSTLVFDLTALFLPWPIPAVPPALGPAASECVSYTYDLLPAFNQGYWTFKRSTSTFGGNYSLSLFNTGQTNNTGTFWTVAKANLLAVPSLSASWRLKGTCVLGSTAGNTQRISMNSPAADSTSFNALYTTVQSNVQLPIELLYFNAEPSGDAIISKWETASETDNDHFEVERSIDGEKFEKVGDNIPGCGPGTCPDNHFYSLTDYEKCKGLVYYRLKQVDIDGKYTYSDVVAIDCGNRANHLNVHPNPAQSSITITYNESNECNVTVSIIDYTGRVIFKKVYAAKKGLNQQQINIDNLSDGAYYLDLHSDDINTSSHRQIRFFKELK